LCGKQAVIIHTSIKSIGFANDSDRFNRFATQKNDSFTKRPWALSRNEAEARE